MTKDERLAAEREFERVKEILDGAGIDWEQHSPYISFDAGKGECWVFPSQSYDGKLFVRYVGTTRVDTAEEAMALCGVIDDEG